MTNMILMTNMDTLKDVIAKSVKRLMMNGVNNTKRKDVLLAKESV
jgi:hypothetical protein